MATNSITQPTYLVIIYNDGGCFMDGYAQGDNVSYNFTLYLFYQLLMTHSSIMCCT